MFVITKDISLDFCGFPTKNGVSVYYTVSVYGEKRFFVLNECQKMSRKTPLPYRKTASPMRTEVRVDFVGKRSSTNPSPSSCILRSFRCRISDLFGYKMGGKESKPKEEKKTWDGRKYNVGEELFKGVTPGMIFEAKVGKEDQKPPSRHTIFGANTVVAKELRKSLAKADISLRFRFVHDRYIPKQLFESDETWMVDYMEKEAVDYVINGSSHVYMLNEFEYATRVWKEKWPKFVQLVVDSCIKHKAKLIFLDNDMVYATADVGNMTEESSEDPESKKGKVRKECGEIIMNNIKSGNAT